MSRLGDKDDSAGRTYLIPLAVSRGAGGVSLGRYVIVLMGMTAISTGVGGVSRRGTGSGGYDRLIAVSHGLADTAHTAYGITGALVRGAVGFLTAGGADLPVSACVLPVFAAIHVVGDAGISADVTGLVTAIVVSVAERLTVGKGFGSALSATTGQVVNGGLRAGCAREEIPLVGILFRISVTAEYRIGSQGVLDPAGLVCRIQKSLLLSNACCQAHTFFH